MEILLILFLAPLAIGLGFGLFGLVVDYWYWLIPAAIVCLWSIAY
jgi:hypothetical protein